MRQIKSFYDMTEGYAYKVVDDNDRNVKYGFSDEKGNEFLVVFKNDLVGPRYRPVLGTTYELTYFARDPETGDWSLSASVPTNIYRVVRTVLGDVLRDFTEARPWVSTIRVEGLPKEGEIGRSKRTKIYLRFLESNPVPDFRIEMQSQNRFILSKNKK